MNVAMVLLLFATVLVLDGRIVWKGTPRGVKIIYFSMLLPSFVLLLLYSLDVPVPALGSAITRALKAMLPFVS